MCAGVRTRNDRTALGARPTEQDRVHRRAPVSCAMRATAVVDVVGGKAGAAERVVGRNDDALAGPGRDGGVPPASSAGGIEFDSLRELSTWPPPGR